MRRLKSIIFLGLTVTVGLLSSCGSDDKKPTPAPSISGFTPTSGEIGAAVTISGSNFSAVAAENQVKFGAIAATVSAATVTSISTTVPTGASTGKISVTVNGQTATSTADFTVNFAPSISSFAPTSGVVGTTVTITGTNFSTTLANNLVRFNGTAATVTAATPTSLTVTVPAGASSGKITVAVNTLSATSTTDFTVTPPPAITSFAPDRACQGVEITITGTNFINGTGNTVLFNGVQGTIVFASGTQLRATVPAGATTGKITIQANGVSVVSTTDFTVTPPPTITGFSPNQAPAGATVTLTGTNFIPTPNLNIVRFNNIVAQVTAVNSPTSMTVTIPVGAITGRVTIQAGNQAVFTSANDFVITNTWSNKADFGNSINSARSNAIAFSIGDKGYVGTGYDGGVTLKDMWEYDAVLNTWSQKADFGGSARTGAVGFAIGTKGYVGTGSTGSNFATSVVDFWEYDQPSNTWTQKADFPGLARWLAIGFSVGTKGYVGTGEVSSGGEAVGLWEYDPSTNAWTSRATFPGIARRAATAFSLNGRGYVGTGASSNNSALSDFFEFDPTSNTWATKASLPIGLFGAFGAATTTRGYIGGVGFVGALYEYNASSNTWSMRANYPNSSGLYSVAFALPNQRIYVGTGTTSGGTRTRTFFEYLPQ